MTKLYEIESHSSQTVMMNFDKITSVIRTLNSDSCEVIMDNGVSHRVCVESFKAAAQKSGNLYIEFLN